MCTPSRTHRRRTKSPGQSGYYESSSGVFAALDIDVSSNLKWLETVQSTKRSLAGAVERRIRSKCPILKI